MQNLDFKIAGRRARSFSEDEPRLARHHTWVAVGVGVAGVAASAYGANKQSKDNKAAQSQNVASQDEQNRLAWANYLMTRGLDPSGAQTGVIPTSGRTVNTRLPLYANVVRPGAAAKGFRVTGSTAPRLATRSTTPPVDPALAAAAPTASGGSSRANDFLIGNPLGIGGKDRSWHDPLGIF